MIPHIHFPPLSIHFGWTPSNPAAWIIRSPEDGPSEHVGSPHETSTAIQNLLRWSIIRRSALIARRGVTNQVRHERLDSNCHNKNHEARSTQEKPYRSANCRPGRMQLCSWYYSITGQQRVVCIIAICAVHRREVMVSQDEEDGLNEGFMSRRRGSGGIRFGKPSSAAATFSTSLALPTSQNLTIRTPRVSLCCKYTPTAPSYWQHEALRLPLQHWKSPTRNIHRHSSRTTSSSLRSNPTARIPRILRHLPPLIIARTGQIPPARLAPQTPPR